MPGYPGDHWKEEKKKDASIKVVLPLFNLLLLYLLTSQMLPDRESAVHVEATKVSVGFRVLALQAQGGGQHGLLTLPSSVHVLLVQRLGEAEHEEGRQEE